MQNRLFSLQDTSFPVWLCDTLSTHVNAHSGKLMIDLRTDVPTMMPFLDHPDIFNKTLVEVALQDGFRTFHA